MPEERSPTEETPKEQRERTRHRGIGIGGADERKRILWVDSDPVMCAYAKAILEPTYEVLLGWDGQSGLTLFRQRLPHLVVLNVVLSDMEWLDCSEKMVSSNPRVPIILTGRYIAFMSIDPMAALKAGVRNIVLNPLDAPHLLEEIAKRLEQAPFENEERFRHFSS